MKKKIRKCLQVTIFSLFSVFLLTNCDKTPTLTTKKITEITLTTAKSGGDISNDGGTVITERGVCWSTNPNPTIADKKTINGSGVGSFTSVITGLTINTTYYLRSYATNSKGTAYGNEISFIIENNKIPIVTTDKITVITHATAKSGGNISSDGGAAIIEQGVCWSTHSKPTIANNKTIDSSGVGAFTSYATHLTANTTYYVRAYATNNVGTGYGNVLSFTTLKEEKDKVIDIDGNVYKTVTIGTQTWMAENLKTTKYNDGTEIPNEITLWANITTPSYCWYSNSQHAKDTYGALYNWYAISDKICPTGWHMPFLDEWEKLIDYLGGLSVAGGKLKETDTTHWYNPNAGATNETGFTALPGGYHDENKFIYMRSRGYWWTKTGCGACKIAFAITMFHHVNNVKKEDLNTHWGLSARCVKN